jgi:hypothetical protein
MQLIRAYQAQGETDWIIQEAESIKEHPEFLKSPVVLYYALALDAKGDSEAAQPYFESIDKRYSNYAERVQLARHYIDKAEEEKALAILDEVLAEAATMGKDSRRQHRIAIGEAQKLRQSI